MKVIATLDTRQMKDDFTDEEIAHARKHVLEILEREKKLGEFQRFENNIKKRNLSRELGQLETGLEVLRAEAEKDDAGIKTMKAAVAFAEAGLLEAKTEYHSAEVLVSVLMEAMESLNSGGDANPWYWSRR